MKPHDTIKYFGLNNLSIESEIKNLEKRLGIDLGHSGGTKSDEIDQTYYPQFSMRLRKEAERMAKNYVIFYCLENAIRELIAERLHESEGEDWWEKVVPDNVKKHAEENRRKEIRAGVTPRSTALLDFTNFGELGEIIKIKWDIFGDMFTDKNAVEKVLAMLNTLRAPIAHCNALAEDEEIRLHLGLKDWFRQME